MKKIKKIDIRKFLVLGMVFICGICFGQKTFFIYVGESNNQKNYACVFKKDSTKGTSDIWIKTIPPNEIIKNINQLNETEIKDFTMLLCRFFCDEKKYLALAVKIFENGEQVFSKTYEDNTPEYITPNTLLESSWDFACNGLGVVDWDIILNETKQ